MKKALFGILSAAIALSLCAATAFAACPGGRHHYVDVNGAGVCNNAGSRCFYVDANGDGVCDACGAKHGSCLSGRGTAFVDANGDGICDNCGAYHRCHEGGFVDANGDGICDYYQSGQGRGCGSRHGGHGCRGGRNR